MQFQLSEGGAKTRKLEAGAAAGGDSAALLNRMDALELKLKDVVKEQCQQGDTLRALEAWTTKTWYLKAGMQLAKALTDANDSYNGKKKLGSAHPDGPPRRTLAYVLLNQFIVPAATTTAELTQVAEFHKQLTKPEDLEKQSIQYMTTYKVKDGGLILKIRPYREKMELWAPALAWLGHYIASEGGEERPETGPPSNRSKELKNWAYRK